MVAPTSNITSPSQFTYDAKSMRYRNASTGRYISAKEVRSAVDTIIDKEAVAFRGVAQQLIDGKINLAEFQLQMQANVKKLNVAMALAGNGGIANTDQSDLGYIGSLVKKQYQYLQGMAKQIKNGHQKLDGTLLARVELYAQAARGTHEDVKRRQANQSGMGQEKSVLAEADHCAGCLSQAKRGWSEIGSLIPVGGRECLVNCHCHFIFR
jgi:hypothetical protein